MTIVTECHLLLSVIVKNSLAVCRLGEVCSHVAAVLFKLEIAFRNGYTSPSCTSMPCSWNQGSVKKVL